MEYNVCVVIRHPPYGTVLPAEAYRTIQALQTFERDVTVLFMADGVLSLVGSTDPEPIGMQRLAEPYTSLLYLSGVTLAVHPPSLLERGFSVEDLVELPGDNEYHYIGNDEIEEYITGHKTVLCF
jgi:sulfur relay (sulfurtransferase) DsrF/TusC family protein